MHITQSIRRELTQCAGIEAVLFTDSDGLALGCDSTTDLPVERIAAAAAALVAYSHTAGSANECTPDRIFLNSTDRAIYLRSINRNLMVVVILFAGHFLHGAAAGIERALSHSGEAPPQPSPTTLS